MPSSSQTRPVRCPPAPRCSDSPHARGHRRSETAATVRVGVELAAPLRAIWSTDPGFTSSKCRPCSPSSAHHRQVARDHRHPGRHAFQNLERAAALHHVAIVDAPAAPARRTTAAGARATSGLIHRRQEFHPAGDAEFGGQRGELALAAGCCRRPRSCGAASAADLRRARRPRVPRPARRPAYRNRAAWIRRGIRPRQAGQIAVSTPFGITRIFAGSTARASTR